MLCGILFDMVTDSRSEKIKKVVAERRNDVVVVLEDIHDPHNAQAIFRTCEIFGIQRIILIAVHQNKFDPKGIGKSSSSSANKWLDFEWHYSTQSCLEALKKDGFSIAVTALDSRSEAVVATDFTKEKIALVIGNEHRGVSDIALSLADKVVKIGMVGMAQSLNVSVSTALCVFEITRQRKFLDKGYCVAEIAALEDDFLNR